jgi:hypothetical protein
MRRLDRFILDPLAFELPDLGGRLGLASFAVVNNGFEGFRG